MSKISLHGFNNLTKSLSFSLYKLHYLADDNAIAAYNAYIAKRFCADKLNVLLTDICHAIGGNVLNVAMQDYQPQGASVTLMISEGEQAQPLPKYLSTSLPTKLPAQLPADLVAHLDKSHLCIHTYPDDFIQDSLSNNIAIFRADIELSTCGVISPLKVVNYVIDTFNADVIDIDYRIRGVTKSSQGGKIFIDQVLNNISDHISSKLLAAYTVENNNLSSQNIFHTKLCKSKVTLKDYFLKYNQLKLTKRHSSEIKIQIARELQQLYTKSV